MPSNRTKRRLAQMGYTHRHSFIFINREGLPFLLLPSENRRVFLAGLRIYAPQKMRGKVLRAVVSELPRLGGARWLPKRLTIASTEALPLAALVSRLTGEPSPAFAWFINSSAYSSKINLQAMGPNGKILGYLKLSLSRVAFHSIQHEARVLNQLWGYPELRPRIPRVLYEGRWSDGYLMMLSALPGKPGPLAFTSLHQEFLRTLSSLQPVECPGESLVTKTREKWEEAMSRLGPDWAEIGQTALTMAGQLLQSRSVPCGIIHGDFVPENTRVLDERLLVFDWERSKAAMPCTWDIFHFHLELAFLLGKNVEEVFAIPESPVDRACWLLYLLDSACRLAKSERTRARAGRLRYRYHLLSQEVLLGLSREYF